MLPIFAFREGAAGASYADASSIRPDQCPGRLDLHDSEGESALDSVRTGILFGAEQAMYGVIWKPVRLEVREAGVGAIGAVLVGN